MAWDGLPELAPAVFAEMSESYEHWKRIEAEYLLNGEEVNFPKAVQKAYDRPKVLFQAAGLTNKKVRFCL